MQRYIPPGGFVGAQSNTMAAQATLLGAPGPMSSRGGARRKRRSARSNGGSRRSARKSRGSSRAARKAARFVKGSAAAKRHMARLRKMRRK